MSVMFVALAMTETDISEPPPARFETILWMRNVPVHTHRVRHHLAARLTLLASFRGKSEPASSLQTLYTLHRDDFLRESGVRWLRES